VEGWGNREQARSSFGLLEVVRSLAGIEQWDVSDPRSALRIPCEINCQLKDRGGSSQPATVADIGLRGLRLMVQGKVRKGSVVELASAQRDGQAVRCRIEWKKSEGDGVLMGVSFQDSPEALSHSWLIDELKAIGVEAVQTALRRRGIRVICDAPALFTCMGEKREAMMRDLGLGGALVQCPGPLLKAGESAGLEFGPVEALEKIALTGQVVAVYDREIPRYGVRFDTFSLGGVTDLERYLTYYFEQTLT
jgi:hypothetical protein